MHRSGGLTDLVYQVRAADVLARELYCAVVLVLGPVSTCSMKSASTATAATVQNCCRAGMLVNAPT